MTTLSQQNDVVNEATEHEPPIEETIEIAEMPIEDVIDEDNEKLRAELELLPTRNVTIQVPVDEDIRLEIAKEQNDLLKQMYSLEDEKKQVMKDLGDSIKYLDSQIQVLNVKYRERTRDEIHTCYLKKNYADSTVEYYRLDTLELLKKEKAYLTTPELFEKEEEIEQKQDLTINEMVQYILDYNQLETPATLIEFCESNGIVQIEEMESLSAEIDEIGIDSFQEKYKEKVTKEMIQTANEFAEKITNL